MRMGVISTSLFSEVVSLRRSGMFHVYSNSGGLGLAPLGVECDSGIEPPSAH